MRLKLALFIAVTVWALSATVLAIYEHGWAKQMLALAETEYDRRIVEEQFFNEFVDMKKIVIDPHTSPFAGEKVESPPPSNKRDYCEINGQVIQNCKPTPDGKGIEGDVTGR